MKSKWLQAAILGSALFFLSWITLSSRSKGASRILSASRSYTSQKIQLAATTPVDASTKKTTVEQLVSEALAGDDPTNGLSPKQLQELLEAARHWTAAPISLSERPDPIPNGRPSMPEPAEFAATAPHFKSGGAPEPTDDGSGLDHQLILNIVESIFDLGYTMFWRMECPNQDHQGARYDVLKEIAKKESKIKYFFALDLTQIARLLPRLMGTLVQVIKYLGPEKCAVSIVEGRSTDGTYLILHEVGKALTEMGVEYYLQQSDVDPHGEGMDRIGGLAILRNLAMSPLISERELYAEQPITAFINDVALCPDDILELLYQHVYQNASMTCAMDWVFGGDVFYDSWVSRSMSGNTFFEISQDVSWAFHKNLFWDDPISKPKYEKFQPFQCYSCWGGMVTLDSVPFQNGEIKFRNATDGECYAGEPTLLAQDLFRIGQGRIATIPSVNVAYNDAEGSRTKKRRGLVSDRVNVRRAIAHDEDDPQSPKIEWLPPPAQVKCMPTWNRQSWVPPF